MRFSDIDTDSINSLAVTETDMVLCSSSAN